MIGVIGTHLARGRTVIIGYTVWGLCVALLALTGNLPIALGLMFGSASRTWSSSSPLFLLYYVLKFYFSFMGFEMVGGMRGSSSYLHASARARFGTLAAA